MNRIDISVAEVGVESMNYSKKERHCSRCNKRMSIWNPYKNFCFSCADKGKRGIMEMIDVALDCHKYYSLRNIDNLIRGINTVTPKSLVPMRKYRLKKQNIYQTQSGKFAVYAKIAGKFKYLGTHTTMGKAEKALLKAKGDGNVHGNGTVKRKKRSNAGKARKNGSVLKRRARVGV